MILCSINPNILNSLYLNYLRSFESFFFDFYRQLEGCVFLRQTLYDLDWNLFFYQHHYTSPIPIGGVLSGNCGIRFWWVFVWNSSISLISHLFGPFHNFYSHFQISNLDHKSRLIKCYKKSLGLHGFSFENFSISPFTPFLAISHIFHTSKFLSWTIKSAS